ncbi:hypothetical protein ACH9DO_16030, partial [Kocuria sp. M1N1S27]|uniref:aldose epimerase family protein n=1 Tax=Kocuria kalidii TaxID=3376283 RepID=UPI0037B8C677
GHPYHRRAGIALEPQHHPDSPNHPELTDPVLRPGETYHSRTEWRFAVGDTPTHRAPSRAAP